MLVASSIVGTMEFGSLALQLRANAITRNSSDSLGNITSKTTVVPRLFGESVT